MEGRVGRRAPGGPEAGGPARPEPLLHRPARREAAQGRVHDCPASDGTAPGRGYPSAGERGQARPRVLRDGVAEDPGRVGSPRPNGSGVMGSRHAPPADTPGSPPVPQPTYAERARTLAHVGRVGTLATLSRRHPGHPFASVMPYALDGDAHPEPPGRSAREPPGDPARLGPPA